MSLLDIFKKDNGREFEIKKDIETLKMEIEAAKSRYNFEDAPELIDSHIYEICSLEKKVNYLIKELKKINELKLNDNEKEKVIKSLSETNTQTDTININ